MTKFLRAATTGTNIITQTDKHIYTYILLLILLLWLLLRLLLLPLLQLYGYYQSWILLELICWCN